jgi:hypothetical protein
MTDYKAMFENRSAEFDELNEQFILYQGTLLPTQRRLILSSTISKKITPNSRANWPKLKISSTR